MKQLHVFVVGFVQGVGFRAFTVKKAREKKITGWVRNLKDGRVEAVLQGEERALQFILKDLKKGSYFSQVKDLIVDEERITEEFFEMKKLPTV